MNKESQEALKEMQSIDLSARSPHDRLIAGKMAVDWIKKWGDRFFDKGPIPPAVFALIKAQPTPRSPEIIDYLMTACPAEWLRFCSGGPCACMGCANGSFEGHITKEEWDGWVERNL